MKRLPPMAADMKTIAEMLGVSKTTVHRALCDTGRINAETKARIVALAAKLDYRPNNLARGLRSQRSATIGVCAIGINSSFYSAVLQGVEEVAGRHGYNVLLSCSRGYPSREIAQLDLMREKRVDGLIIAPADPGKNLEYYRRMQRADIPFVLIDRHIPELDSDYVTTDNRTGGYLAAKHLVSLGREKPCFLLPPRGERNATSVRDRIEGFTAGLREHGIESMTFIGEDEPNIQPIEEFGRRAVKRFFDLRLSGDCIMAANDNLAMGAMQGIMQAGLSIPDDIAIIGFDDLIMSPYAIPPLTTIRQPKVLVGEKAVSVLVERIASRPDRPTSRILLEPDLVVRESCGASRLWSS